MKNFNQFILPDVGYYLLSDNSISLKIHEGKSFTEIPIDTNNINIIGDYAFIDKAIAIKISDKREMKTKLVKQLFSLDDQIAIILNEDSEMIEYMNLWRSWFSTIIDLILDMKNG